MMLCKDDREHRLTLIARSNRPGLASVATRSVFTLIELLVVIAIIAILASLLMPALGRAKYQAKLVVCLSGLKQAGTAALMYAGDSNSFYPKRLAVDDSGWGGPETMVLNSSYPGSYFIDDRPLWRSMGLDQLACPFGEPVNMNDTSSGHAVLGPYAFYFGMWYKSYSYLEKSKYRTAPETRFSSWFSGMPKIDRHLRRADGTEFDILASDVNTTYGLAGKQWSGHPDRGTGALSMQPHAEGGRLHPFWRNDFGRGAVDLNFCREDGSAFTVRQIEMTDSRLSHIPYKMDNNSGKNIFTQKWSQIPSIEQCDAF